MRRQIFLIIDIHLLLKAVHGDLTGAVIITGRGISITDCGVSITGRGISITDGGVSITDGGVSITDRDR